MGEQDGTTQHPKGSLPAIEDYEPPMVEKILNPADLEHEILYAGAAGGSADA
jgi:hypothetical protein